MDCLNCRAKSCRTLQSCGAEKFSRSEVRNYYLQPDQSVVVENAAGLVDGGRAGTLSRISELLEFAGIGGYRKVGLAYCFGMEDYAEKVRSLFRQADIPCIGISCTCGAMAQSDVNTASSLPGVSCNPLSQARQMNAEGVDLAVILGLCLGHDILFTGEFQGDQTTLLVKDRVHNHNPLAGIEELARE